MIIVRFFLILAIVVFMPFSAFCDDKHDLQFITIKSNNTNVRTGPSTDHPIKIRYNRGGIPVIMINQYENWVKIRDFWGDEGWVMKVLTTSMSKLAIVNMDDTPMRYLSTIKSRPKLILKRGVIIRYKVCKNDWCKVVINKKSGWVLKKSLWGIKNI